MAGSCWELYNWLAIGCELNNNQTMFLELTIAFVGAIILAGYFYWREDKQRKESDKIIKDAKDTLKRIEPFLIGQEQQENFRKFKVLREFKAALTNCKVNLGFIDIGMQEHDMESSYVQEAQSSLINYSERMEEIISINGSWILPHVNEMKDIVDAIGQFATEGFFTKSKYDTIEKITKKINEFIPIIINFQKQFIVSN